MPIPISPEEHRERLRRWGVQSSDATNPILDAMKAAAVQGLNPERTLHAEPGGGHVYRPPQGGNFLAGLAGGGTWTALPNFGIGYD